MNNYMAKEKKRKENWITWKKWTDSKKRSIFQD